MNQIPIKYFYIEDKELFAVANDQSEGLAIHVSGPPRIYRQSINVTKDGSHFIEWEEWNYR